MNTQQFFKGLAIMLVSLFVALFSQTPIIWGVVIITVLGNTLVYAGKNAYMLLKSDSPANTLSKVNWVSALIILLGTGLLDGIAIYVIDGVVQWLLIGKMALSVTLTYLGSTLFAGPNPAQSVPK